MRRRFGLAMVPMLAASSGYAATWYVGPSGSDRNDGRSVATAFQSLQKGADSTAPGDVVLVLSGTYTVKYPGADALDINRSGTAGAPIQFKAMAGAHPVIDMTNGWTGIRITASFVRVSGFEVVGDAQKITPDVASQHAKERHNWQVSGNGILVWGTLAAPQSHIVISNNLVHDAPGVGIGVMRADYITIAQNTTYRNGFWSPYAGSGISIYESRDVDDNTGYKNFVIQNKSSENRNFVPSIRMGFITDGNGIIIDDNLNSQSDHRAYGGRTYVANNIVVSNGGSGIHAFLSRNVDIVCNTAYFNNMSPTLDEGQIFARQSDYVRMINNIAVAPPLKVLYSSQGNGRHVISDYNILFSSTPQAALAGMVLNLHEKMVDPEFLDPAAGRFQLKATSPAIHAGDETFSPGVDFSGSSRPSGNVDDGALQSSAH